MAAGATVLIVEDDRETRTFYTAALMRDGYLVVQAHNGFQALEKALESVPDIVLMDIAVPGLDGIELCRRLRANERTRTLPVLAITGYDDRQYPDRVLDAGANRVLIKPCDSATLIAEMRRLLEERATVPAPR